MSTRLPVVEILDSSIVEILMQKSPAERLSQAFQMWQTARIVVRAAIEQQHPDWEEDRVLRETARRLSHGATERASR